VRVGIRAATPAVYEKLNATANTIASAVSAALEAEGFTVRCYADGAEARFLGKRGDDPAASLAAGELARRGVEVFGPVALGRNGVVVSIVGPDGDRAMASDRGVAPTLSADELEPAWFEGSSHLHLSGYSLMSSPIDGAAVT